MPISSAHHGLRHGEGCQAIRIGATVLVTLDQNRVVFRDQEARDRLTIEVVVERQVEPGEAIANDGLARCARQRDRLFRGSEWCAQETACRSGSAHRRGSAFRQRSQFPCSSDIPPSGRTRPHSVRPARKRGPAPCEAGAAWAKACCESRTSASSIKASTATHTPLSAHEVTSSSQDQEYCTCAYRIGL